MNTPTWIRLGVSACAAFAALNIALADAPQVAGVCVAPTPGEGGPVIVPLESTEVILDVKPGLLEAEVIQTFTNYTALALEATYLFPLPHDATLTDFELRYRDRVVRSTVRERAAARQVYEGARDAGQKAALIEQADPALFSTAVANFLPGETVHVVLRFVQPLALRSEAIDVRFPMVTGEKYFPADVVPGTSGHAAPNPERLSTEAVAAGHVYAFDIQIAGIPVAAVESSSHRIRTERTQDGRVLVALAEEITIPDRDLVMQISTDSQAEARPTLVFQHTDTGDYGLLTIFPPMSRERARHAAAPRDMLFLLDCSGSMSGPRLASAKLGLEGCLAAMLPEDRFQIVTFESTHTLYAQEFTRATPDAVAKAIAFVRGLQAGGGTHLQPALGASLAAFGVDAREHVLVLLTDGDVGNADSLLNLVEQGIARTRLFSFGIGAAPNAFLMTRIAELGRGQVRFIEDPAGIERELRDLFETLDAPVLADARVTLLDAAGAPVEFTAFPQKLPDVFVGRPLQTTFRTTTGAPRWVRVEGVTDGAPVHFDLPVAESPLRGDALEKQFGRAWYAQLEGARRRAETEEGRRACEIAMVNIATEFQLVTELTSRVAVERKVSRDPAAPLQSVHVGQYVEADRVITVDGEEIISLSPFTVDASGDGDAYTASTTLAGSRLNTNLRDVGSGVTVITRKMLHDIGATDLECVANYATEPLDDPRWVRAGADVGLVGGLPLATILFPAEIDRLTWRSHGPAWGNVDIHGAGRARRNALTIRIGDEGVLAGTLEATFGSRAGEGPKLAALLDWTRAEHEQRSLLVDARHDGENGHLRGTMHARDLGGYGRLGFVRAGAAWRWSDALRGEVNLAAHELTRADSQQFRSGSPHDEYAGLGLFNLDLLTAETRRLRDRVAVVDLDGGYDLPWGRQAWSLRWGWHRQESSWSDTESGDAVVPSRRQNRRLFLGFRSHLADFGHVEGGAGWARHGIPGSEETTRQWSAGVTVHVTSAASIFIMVGRDEILPWLPLDLSAGMASAVEERAGGEAGLKLSLWDERLAATFSYFRDQVDHFTARDWAAESAAWSASGGGGPIQYVRWPQFERTGWMGECDVRPIRSFALRGTWYVDTKNAAPERGGNHRASLLARYDFEGGWWKGCFLGGGVSYRNALRFTDGVALPGGVRDDLFLGFTRNWRGKEILVQLNFAGVFGENRRATRFAPDRGREVRVTLAREF